MLVNGIAYFIYFLDVLLLVYRNTTFFLYVDLLNLLTSVSTFLEESLGFPLHNIIASANKDSYPAFFSIRAPFISFSSLTVLARIFSTLLNRSETIES